MNLSYIWLNLLALKIKNNLLIAILLIAFASQVQAINVSLTHSHFQSEQGSYVEVYVRISGNSVDYQMQTDSIGQASVLGLILIKKDDAIISLDKFSLLSPVGKDKKDFWSKRTYKLDPGVYKMEYTFSDEYDAENTINEQRVVKVDDKKEQGIYSSDIMLFAKIGTEDHLPFGKYGLMFEPLAYDLVTPEFKSLIFNWELYGLKSIGEKLFMSMTVYEGFAGDFGKKLLQKHMPLKDGNSQVVLEDISILDLQSGQFHLTLEIYNKELVQLHYREKNFAMVQPVSDIRVAATYDKEFDNSFVSIMTEKEVEYSLRAISSQLQGNLVESLNEVLSSGTEETKKYFLYSYWSQITPDQPGEAYKAYMKVIRAVDEEYGNHFGYGFETDRGHIFMKYGRPNDVIKVEDEINAPPYSIWIYYDFPTTQQSNVKFMFYNPSLSGDDFILLHSNCTGEVQNKQWEQLLYSDAFNQAKGNTIDGTEMEDNFNRKARRYFNDN